MTGAEQLLRLRLRAQRLAPRSGQGAAGVARAVCGIQAQDARAAALSIRARSERLTAAGVAGDRGLVRTWAWRGTLHLLAADDVGWVLPLVAAGAIRGVRARWRQLGLDEPGYERARELIRERLAAEGAPTRGELRERLAAGGVDASGQRLPHLLRRAALDGVLCLGAGDTVTALESWTPAPRERALGVLARRYLAAYGPAQPLDLAAWSGLPAADVRAAWTAVADELVAVGDGWALDRGPAAPTGTVVRLLPSFDTYLLGHRTRDAVVAPQHARRVAPGGGWLHPVLLVDGRAAGTWRAERSRDRLTVRVAPFGALPAAVRAGVEAEAGDVGRFLGLPATLA